MTYFQVGSGDVVGSAHMNTAINQGTPPFASAAARDSAYAAIGGPQPGMSCYRSDINRVDMWNGTFWEPIAGSVPTMTVYWMFQQYHPVGSSALGGGTIAYANADAPQYDPNTGDISFTLPGMYNFQLTVVTMTPGVSIQAQAVDNATRALWLSGTYVPYGGETVSIVSSTDYYPAGIQIEIAAWGSAPFDLSPLEPSYLSINYLGSLMPPPTALMSRGGVGRGLPQRASR
jgi:hypothetical protein